MFVSNEREKAICHKVSQGLLSEIVVVRCACTGTCLTNELHYVWIAGAVGQPRAVPICGCPDDDDVV